MLKQFHKTLRFRLTFWNTLVVLFAASLALIALRDQRRRSLVNETRDLLREESIELDLAIRKLYPDLTSIRAEFERKVMSHSQHRWFAQLSDKNQESVYRSANYPELPGPTDGEPALEGQPFGYQSTNNFQLVRHPVQINDGTRFGMVLGTPNEIIDNNIADLTRLMLLIGVGLLVVAPVGGYLLARNATQPVREIIRTTRSLDPAHLDSRLEIRGSGDELDQISIEINSFLDQISKYLQSHREFQ